MREEKLFSSLFDQKINSPHLEIFFLREVNFFSFQMFYLNIHVHNYIQKYITDSLPYKFIPIYQPAFVPTTFLV